MYDPVSGHSFFDAASPGVPLTLAVPHDCVLQTAPHAPQATSHSSTKCTTTTTPYVGCYSGGRIPPSAYASHAYSRESLCFMSSTPF